MKAEDEMFDNHALVILDLWQKWVVTTVRIDVVRVKHFVML